MPSDLLLKPDELAMSLRVIETVRDESNLGQILAFLNLMARFSFFFRSRYLTSCNDGQRDIWGVCVLKQPLASAECMRILCYQMQPFSRSMGIICYQLRAATSKSPITPYHTGKNEEHVHLLSGGRERAGRARGAVTNGLGCWISGTVGTGFTIMEVPNSNLPSCYKRISEVNS